MFRKLGIGLATLAFLTPGIAAALGVGEYRLNSYLNQPLDMRVQLHETGDLNATEVLVDLADETDFETAGVERTYFLSDLDFEVRMDDQGGGTLYITSSRPVREPYLNFVIEIFWPTGRMLREYTVLLDPPGTAEQETASRPQPAESVARPVQPQQPAEPVSSREDTSDRRVVAESRGDQQNVERDNYEVKANDTMWRIAVNHRPSTNVSVQQMLVAIQRLNPDAFIDGNVNLVREGTVLRIPTREEIRAINTRQALGDIASQNRKWREMLRARGIDPDKAQLDGRARQVADRGEEAGSGEGQVTLVTDSGDAGGEGTGTGGEGSADASALQNELAIREESLDRLRRENQELASRLDDLEEQVNTSENLLELRNQKIARLQKELSELQKKQGVEVSDELLTPVEEPGQKPADEAGEAPAEQVAAADQTDKAQQKPAAAEGDAQQDMKPGEQQTAAEGEVSAEGKPADQAAATEDTEKTAEAAPAKPAKPAQPAQPEPPESLVSRILDFVMGNLIMLAVGLVVIIALVVGGVLMLRKRAAGDEEEEPLVDVEEDSDFLPAGLMEGEDEGDFGGEEEPAAPQGEGQDPLEEVDVYVAYGRYPQAVDYLRDEINKAPERSDLKIRLLEVLAEMRDTDGFEQEASKLAGSDDDIDARIDALRKDPGGSEGGGAEPSLDDLEMDLTADLDDGEPAGGGASDQEDETLVLDAGTDSGAEEEGDFGDFEFSLDDEEGTAEPEEPTESFELDTGDGAGETLELDTGDSATESDDAEDLGDLEFSLDDLDTGEDDEGGSEELSLDEFESDAGGDEELSLEGFDDDKTDSGEEFSLEGFDEDEGDSGEGDSAALQAKPSLDLDEGFDLETDDDQDLDVELEDVSSEFSEAAEEPGSEEIDLSLDDLEEPGEQTPEEPSTEVRSAIEEDTAGEDLDLEEAPAPEPESQPEQKAPADEQAMSADDLLGDDDDFDFLGESDENATKLDLAKAYIDMGDAEGARDILNEVLAEGSEEQQGEARDLLSQVS